MPIERLIKGEKHIAMSVHLPVDVYNALRAYVDKNGYITRFIITDAVVAYLNSKNSHKKMTKHE